MVRCNRKDPMSLPLIQVSNETGLRGVLDLTTQEWAAWLAERGEKPMRARQVRRWILQAGATSFDAMTDLPQSLRQALKEGFVPLSSKVVRHQEATDATHKL